MRERWVVVVMLLAAAGLRLVGLDRVSPPGLSHDEVANWLIDRSILAGKHAVYFTEAYGHEAGFHYLQTGFLALLGDHALALRLPTAFLGILAAAVAYALNRRLFGRQVALVSLAVTAAVLWPVFFSRQGLRAMSLPVTAGLMACFFWGWLRREAAADPPAAPPRPWFSRQRALLLAALLAGLSSYTYMANRALPFFFAGFFLYLAVVHWPLFRRIWPSLLLFLALYGLLSWPIVAFIQTVPAAEVRIAEVDAPLRALLAGDWRPVGQNARAIFGMFGFAGDPLWRHNIASWPVFNPFLALLFYLGVGLTLWRWRDPRHAFLLIWAAAAALPTLLTIDAPSSIRFILLIPVLGTFPGLVIHRIAHLSTVFPKLSTIFSKNLGITLLTIAILLISGLRTARAVFVIWPHNDEVIFVWQEALTQIAADLDARPAITEAAVAGWTPDSMDEPTLAVTLQREDVRLRHLGTVGEISTVILPGGEPAAGALYRPAALPLAPPLAGRLLDLGLVRSEAGSFERYAWSIPITPRPAHPLGLTFGDELELLGYDLLSPCAGDAGPTCQLLTYWRVLAVPPTERRFFAHLVDAAGAIAGQHDALEAPARYWQPGDLLIQLHTLPTTTPPAAIRLGVYQPQPPFPRLPLATGEEFVIIDLP